MKRKVVTIFLMIMCITIALLPVSAHPGRTDSNGGHYDHSTGEYHYHHGNSAHQHYDIDGDGIKDCPLKFKTSSNRISNDGRILIISVLITLSPFFYIGVEYLFESILGLQDKPSRKVKIVITVVIILILSLVIYFI